MRKRVILTRRISVLFNGKIILLLIGKFIFYGSAFAGKRGFYDVGKIFERSVEKIIVVLVFEEENIVWTLVHIRRGPTRHIARMPYLHALLAIFERNVCVRLLESLFVIVYPVLAVARFVKVYVDLRFGRVVFFAISADVQTALFFLGLAAAGGSDADAENDRCRKQRADESFCFFLHKLSSV